MRGEKVFREGGENGPPYETDYLFLAHAKSYNTSEKTCLQGFSSAVFQRKRRFGEDKAQATTVARDKIYFCRVSTF